jgi:HEAT repeat protein
MDPKRQKLIEKARELNTSDFPVIELQERIREVCSEFLIEAKVDVDRLLRHGDWRVRSGALDMVWWGVGATDGIDQSIEILMHDPDEDVRAEAALALYEASRGTANEKRVKEALTKAADTDQCT